MGLDKQTTAQLTRFATAFREARDRGANESDTVMYLVKFFEDVLGYDSLKGEILGLIRLSGRQPNGVQGVRHGWRDQAEAAA